MNFDELNFPAVLMNTWLLRTQKKWASVLPHDLVSAQSENELQRMILRGVTQGARVSDIARSLRLSRAQACHLRKVALQMRAFLFLSISRRRAVKR